MKLKPIYEKSIMVKFRRGNDLQCTELVETNWQEVHTLIADTFHDRFKKPKTGKQIPATIIYLAELDNQKHQLKAIPFVHTKDGKDFQKPSVMVFNMSPREARIQFEKAVNTK